MTTIDIEHLRTNALRWCNNNNSNNNNNNEHQMPIMRCLGINNNSLALFSFRIQIQIKRLVNFECTWFDNCVICLVHFHFHLNRLDALRRDLYDPHGWIRLESRFYSDHTISFWILKFRRRCEFHSIDTWARSRGQKIDAFATIEKLLINCKYFPYWQAHYTHNFLVRILSRPLGDVRLATAAHDVHVFWDLAQRRNFSDIRNGCCSCVSLFHTRILYQWD